MGAFLFVLVASLTAYAIWRSLYENYIVVDPGDRERVVIRDIGGRMKVLGPGTHYLPGWWTLFERVSINRESRRIPLEGKQEEVKSKNGVVLYVSGRYDIIVGRPFSHRNGQQAVQRIDDTTEVNDNLILCAVLKIDYSDRKKHIHHWVQHALESVFSSYDDQELMLPGVRHPIVPPEGARWDRFLEAESTEVEGNERARLFPGGRQQVNSVSDLHQRLSYLIELEVNYQLRSIGINIVDFRVTNLAYKDKLMQRAIENQSRVGMLRDGTLVDPNTGAAIDLNDAQRFALGTDQLGQVSIGRGLEALGNGIAKGIKEGNRRVVRPPKSEGDDIAS